MSVNSSSSITRTSCIPGMPWTNAVTTGQKWHNATAFSRSLGCHSPCSRGCAAAPCEAAQRPARAAHATAAHRAAGRWGAPGRTLLAPCCCSRWGEGFCARRTGAASNATLMKKGTPAAQPRLREPKGAHSGVGLAEQPVDELVQACRQLVVALHTEASAHSSGSWASQSCNKQARLDSTETHDTDTPSSSAWT